jgi:hypothetical protein
MLCTTSATFARTLMQPIDLPRKQAERPIVQL